MTLSNTDHPVKVNPHTCYLLLHQGPKCPGLGEGRSSEAACLLAGRDGLSVWSEGHTEEPQARKLGEFLFLPKLGLLKEEGIN